MSRNGNAPLARQREAGRGLESSGGAFTPEDTQTQEARQARRIVRRWPLPWSVARAVARLAWGARHD